MIYFIEAKEFNRIKIGYSSRVSNRVEALQKQSPTELVQLLVIPGNNQEEAQLHRIFKPARTYGEWFDATAELRAYIEKLRTAENPIQVIADTFAALEPPKRKVPTKKSDMQQEYARELVKQFTAPEYWSHRDFAAAGEDFYSVGHRARAWADACAELEFNPPANGSQELRDKLDADFANIKAVITRAGQLAAERIERESDPAYILATLERCQASVAEAIASTQARIAA
jgi:hypothetical protein